MANQPEQDKNNIVASIDADELEAAKNDPRVKRFLQESYERAEKATREGRRF